MFPVPGWLAHGVFNLRRLAIACQVRKIRTENTAAASDHVTAGAVPLVVEETFAGEGIAGGRVVCCGRFEEVHIVKEAVSLGARHDERRHPGFRNAVADQLSKCVPRRRTWLSDVDDRRAVAATG